jgi:hypothetical protein
MHSCVNRNGFSFSERVTTQSHAHVGIKFLYLKLFLESSLLPERRRKDSFYSFFFEKRVGFYCYTFTSL